MKVFAFRFDIDTPKCLGEGVPPLIDLAESLGVKFTFFLNVGQSVSVPNFLKNKFSSPGQSRADSAASLSALKKLGTCDYLYTALVNPRIGPSYPDVVKRLAQSQELGLHGGRNHELWHHQIESWSPQKIKNEIEWGLNWLSSQDIQVKGFSSPGWSETKALPQILSDLGFEFRADRHGVAETWCIKEYDLMNVGTNLTGEPGGVAYLEHQRALGKSDKEVFVDFEDRLTRAGDYAVVYDHPYYAGLKELNLIKQMVQIAQSKGFKVLSLGEIAALSREKFL